MGIELVAKDLVESTKKLVEHRTINVMNTNAMIIASSDNQRIGTFHQGAKQVIETGQAVKISSGDVSNYEGSKEGINMPIYMGNKVMGVVGIYGNPEEIVDVAKLLHLYAEHIMKHGVIEKEQQRKKDIRNQILQRILFPFENKEKDILELCEMISLDLKYPIKVITIDVEKEEMDSLELSENLDKIEQYLLARGLIDFEQDIYGIVKSRFVILKYSSINRKIEPIAKELKELLEGTIKSAISENAYDMQQVLMSYQQVCDLINLSQESGCYNIKEPLLKVGYLFYNMTKGNLRHCTCGIYKTLLTQTTEVELKEIMDTMQAYCDYNGSINKSADSLFIHKNTMLYRLKKLFNLLGIQEEHHFVKEFYMQLLLMYYKNYKEV